MLQVSSGLVNAAGVAGVSRYIECRRWSSCVQVYQVQQVYRVARGAAAQEPELAVVLLTATLVFAHVLTALIVRQVQNLLSPAQFLHLQGITHR